MVSPRSDQEPAEPSGTTRPVSPALCLRCGEGRRLGLARCEACGHSPVDEVDRAAHLVAMDLSDPDRRALMERVRAGGTFEADPDELQATVEALRGAHPVAVGAFALVVGGLPFLLAVVGLGLLAWALLPL